MAAAGLMAADPGEELPDYTAQLQVRVTDEAGVPVPQAKVAFSTYRAWIPGSKGGGRDDYRMIMGVTGTNGMTVMMLKGSTGRYGCMVLPLAGFQWDKGTEYVFTNAAGGRWEPWSPLVTIIMKRRSNLSSAMESLPGRSESSALAHTNNAEAGSTPVSKAPEIVSPAPFPKEEK